MTPEQSQLWKEISNFQLDNPNAAITFTHKLARENGWTVSHTKRVVAEYRKFIFMCCVSEVGVSPSHQVDQAWHMHLTFTKSYWIDLCEHTVKRPIHHHPTQGGKNEDAKHNNLYQHTHQLYLQLFKAKPPGDIWPVGGKATSVKRSSKHVDPQKYWIIAKPGARTVVMITLVFVPVLLIQAIPAVFGPVALIGGVVIFIAFLYKKYNVDDDDEDRRNRGNCSGGSCAYGTNDSGGHGHSHSCHNGHSCSGSCSSGDGCSSACCGGGGGD